MVIIDTRRIHRCFNNFYILHVRKLFLLLFYNIVLYLRYI